MTVIATVGLAGMLALALGGCSGDSGDTTVTDAGTGGPGGQPADGAADPGRGTEPSPTEGGDGVAPVLRKVDVPCPAELDYLTSRSGKSCYQLGDSGGLGADIIESASVEVAGDEAGVQLVMTDAGIARFNALAAQCLDETPTCPIGRVAFVADRAVVATAPITKSDYGHDEVVVTARFSADEARTIAEALSP